MTVGEARLVANSASKLSIIAAIAFTLSESL
jgi:hypothetical protein